MDISFLNKQDQATTRTLFGISGCTDLMARKDTDSVLASLTTDEYIRSCRYVGKEDIKLTSAKRTEEEMVSCLHEAAKFSNQAALRYFLERNPLFFNRPEADTGNLPLHNYLK